MRETSTWICLVVLAYGALLAGGLEWIFQQNIKRILSIMLAVIIAAAIVVQAPLLLNGFGGQVKPIPYPAEWTKVDQMLTELNPDCSTQTLFLPWHLYMSFKWNHSVTMNLAEKFFTCKVVSGTNIEWGSIYDNSGNPTSNTLEAWFKSKGADDSRLREQLPQLKYVLISKDLDWQEYDAWLSVKSNTHVLFDGQMLKLYSIDL